jgi:hypothetical protein
VPVYQSGTRSGVDGEVCEYRKKQETGNRKMLEDFAESGTVDTCRTRRKPGFTNSPALDVQMDPRATYDERP